VAITSWVVPESMIDCGLLREVLPDTVTPLTVMSFTVTTYQASSTMETHCIGPVVKLES